MEADGDWERWVLPTIKDVQQGLKSVPTGRHILAQLLPEPVTVSPILQDGKCVGWEYLGRGALDRFLAGRFCRGNQENRCLSLGVGWMLQSQSLLFRGTLSGRFQHNSQNQWVGKPMVTHIQR